MTDLLSAEGLARFDATAAGYVSDNPGPGSATMPGLVALVARGEQVHSTALGSLRVGGAPMRRDSLFRIASTTKPITAAATLALVGEGLLSLDEPVERLLPEMAERRVLRRLDGPLDDTVPATRSITVRDLLTFTFGFGASLEMFSAPAPWPVVTAADQLHLHTLGPPDPADQPDPDTWIAGLGSLPLMAQPGERWLYNTGASVLGVLVARAAGVPYAEVLRTRILEPLGMSDTGLWTTETDRLATAYRTTPDGLVVWDEPDGAWSNAPAFGDGAAGLLSTVDDLLAFARLLLRNGYPLLPPEAVTEMVSNQLTPAQRAAGTQPFLDGRGWGFGQAVVTEGPHAGAFGWDGGLGTSWLVDPEQDLTVIVLTQRMFDNPELPKVHSELQRAAYNAIGP